MSYDLDTMVAKFRREMEDTVEPYLWSQEDIIDYFEEAQDEFAQEVDAIAGEVELPYTTGEPWVAIPNYITRIRSVELSDNTPIQLYNDEQWTYALRTDDYHRFNMRTNWKSITGPKPEALITDTVSGKARIYPLQDADGVLTATVFRRPLKYLGDTEVFEVTDRQHQRCMLLKARALAYLKHDAETFNENMSATYEAKYLAQLEEINSRVRRSRRRAGTVRYGGL